MPECPSETVKPLLPPGICSAPPYLNCLFSKMYSYSKISQKILSDRVDKILNAKARVFLDNRPRTGEALHAFMCDLLAAYKCDEGKNPDDLLPEIINKNAGNRFTTFGFCKQSTARMLVNFNTIKVAYENCFSTEILASFSINLKDFCQRANDFFGIQLDYNHKIKDECIAYFSFTKDLRGTSNLFFTHEFCNFVTTTQKKEQLYSLYAQLLAVIANTKDGQRRRLNAIFLLAFTIGSNTPLFNEGGGAFVADAMLQILLISANFLPVQKNFLSLTEIELLFRFSTSKQEEWDSIQNFYWASVRNNESNTLFHPQAAGVNGLIKYLNQNYFSDLFHLRVGETIEDKENRQKRLLALLTPEQGNPSVVYEELYKYIMHRIEKPQSRQADTRHFLQERFSITALEVEDPWKTLLMRYIYDNNIGAMVAFLSLPESLQVDPRLHSNSNHIFFLMMNALQKLCHLGLQNDIRNLLGIVISFAQKFDNGTLSDVLFEAGIAWLITTLNLSVHEKNWDNVKSLLNFADILTTKLALSTSILKNLTWTCKKAFSAIPGNHTLLALASKNPALLSANLENYYFCDVDLQQAIAAYTIEPSAIFISDESPGAISRALLQQYQDKKKPNAFSCYFLLQVGNYRWISIIIKTNISDKSAHVISANSFDRNLNKEIYESEIAVFFDKAIKVSAVQVTFDVIKGKLQCNSSSCDAWGVLNLLWILKLHCPEILSPFGRVFLDAIDDFIGCDSIKLKKMIAVHLLAVGAFLKSISTEKETLQLAHQLFASAAIELKFDLNHITRTCLIFHHLKLPADINAENARQIINKLRMFYIKIDLMSYVQTEPTIISGVSFLSSKITIVQEPQTTLGLK